MSTRKKNSPKLGRGAIFMTLAALWMGYRALTAPGEIGQLIKKTSKLQGKVQEEHAALEDLGNHDGLSRLPAGSMPAVAFNRLTAHCPSLDTLATNSWLEIDETGQAFEPYRDAHGHPVSVRTLYTVAK